MLNLTQVPAPRVPLVDGRTGLVSTEWFRYFNGLYAIVGENQNTIQPVNGGTGVSAIPTNGQLLIGNAVGYTLNTLTPGAGIGVTNAAGSITLANTGVLSWSGGATGLTPATPTTGAVTLAGVLNVASGGTNASTASIVSFNNITGYGATGATGIATGETGTQPSWHAGLVLIEAEPVHLFRGFRETVPDPPLAWPRHLFSTRVDSGRISRMMAGQEPN